MAIYEFACDDCKDVFDVFQSIADEKHEANCPKCGKKAGFVFQPILHRVDFTAGQDDGLGAYVNTKKERERVMREKGLERIRD